MPKAWKQRFFLTGSCLLGAGFVLQEATPFFLTFGALFIFTGALVFPPEIRWNRAGGFIIFLWLFTLSGYFCSEDTQSWKSISTRQLALFLIPLGFMGQQSIPYPSRIARIFVYFLTFFALISVFRYLMNYQSVNNALTESGAVPIWDGKSLPWILTPDGTSKFIESGISHIYFSILQAIAILICFLYWQKEKRKSWVVLGVLHFLIIHWFMARTGLLALYGSIAVLGIYQALKQGKIKWLLAGAISIFIFLSGGYFLLDGVKNKVKNTSDDLKAVSGEKDINHRSFAMRTEAWKTALRIIAEKPLGTGSGDVHLEMQRQYARDHTKLFKENRIPPHNQYLETAIASGIQGLICLCLALWLFAAEAWKTRNLLSLGITCIIAVSLLFESMLQTQLGISIFSFFLLFSAEGQQDSAFTEG
jgi:hypothetical protein